MLWHCSLAKNRGGRVPANHRLQGFRGGALHRCRTLDAGFGADHDSEGNRGCNVTTDFGSGSDRPNAVAAQPDGKVVAAGAGTVGDDVDLAVARRNADGTTDPSFNADGRVNSNFVSAMAQGRDVALQSDEKRVAAGYIDNGSNTEFAVARCRDGVVLSTDATLNELTGSGSTKGVTGRWRSRRALFPPHDYQATVPHTTAYPSLTPMAND